MMKRQAGSLVIGFTAAMAASNFAAAADLPGPNGYAMPVRTVRSPVIPAYVQRPYFAEASRFDIYGYPVVIEPPNPLYASTGCPPNLQPIYDATGNFAGYHPTQACR